MSDTDDPWLSNCKNEDLFSKLVIFVAVEGVQQGTLTLTPGSVPLLRLVCAPIVETRCLELAMSLLDFSPWITPWYFLDFALSYSIVTAALTVVYFGSKFELIGVLRHMQRYFSHICDGTDVQADWRRNCTYGRAPNARHFAGFFNVPVLHRHGTTLFHTVIPTHRPS